MTDPPSAVEARIRALQRSRDVRDRLKALAIARSLHPDQANPLLLAALRDRVNYIAAEAASAIETSAGDEELAYMTSFFMELDAAGPRRDAGCHIRSAIAHALAARAWLPGGDVFLRGIQTVQIEAVGGVPFDTAAHLRAHCALGLAEINAPDAVFHIAAVLYDTGSNAIGCFGRPHVTQEPRVAAAHALGRLGSEAAAHMLAIRLRFPNDAEPQVLQQCMESLATIQPGYTLDVLVPFTQGTNEGLACFATMMAARIETEAAAHLVEESVERFRGELLDAVILCLRQRQDDEAASALRRLAAHDRADIRAAVAAALSQAG